MDEAKAKTYLVLPENYLPEGYSIRVVNDVHDNQKCAATVAPNGFNLTLEAEHVKGAAAAGTEISDRAEARHRRRFFLRRWRQFQQFQQALH